MTGNATSFSILILNINALNFPIKRCRIPSQVKKEEFTI
jgi:hypothetical protein